MYIKLLIWMVFCNLYVRESFYLLKQFSSEIKKPVFLMFCDN